ncbi:GNAT family N-acetyltransferase [Actinomadura adrarensis]|uniref:GNAT family N-acetyltransferase n=1 Tax=Actinomadura adrarensis TaxID=1819600 RepID=A0ABW3CSH2_9ACTN
MAVIERFEGTVAQAVALTEEVQREYLSWCGERFAAEYGFVFEDRGSSLAAHEREFTRELPRLLGARGRLVVARSDSEVVGMGALKPVDERVGEIKRMYVRPQVRGQGVGRAILETLVADARVLGYDVARLETATFMCDAQALYRARGFKEIPKFENAEAEVSGLEAFMLFMELRLAG